MSTRTLRTREASDRLAEEIAWLRSFGWDKQRIADRLNVTLSCVEKHLNGSRGAEVRHG
jgi:hypothetical protein